MGKSDKTDKPAEDKIEAETPKTEDIEDAEIIEESADAQAGDGALEDNFDPVEIEEPSDTPDTDTDESDPEVGDESDEIAPESEDDLAEPSEISERESDVTLDSESEPMAANDPVSDFAPEGEPAVGMAEPQPSEPRKTGFVPLVLGGVIAAAIGFGAAFYLGDRLGFGAETEAALTELRQKLDDQNSVITKLQSEQDTIAGTANAARDTAAGVAPLTATAEDLQAQIAALGDRVGAFEDRLTDIEKRPLNEGLSAAAIAAYEREVEDLKDLVAAQKAEASELKDKADLSAKSALARSAVTRIVVALDSGASYRAAIVDFGSATGQAVPEVLEAHADDGIITLAELSESYPDHARAALARARADKVDDAEGSKLGNFLKTQLGVRSVEPREGTDTDATLSRVEAALREGRLGDALSELDTLAEGPKSVMSEWRAMAATRLAATQAAEELAQSLNTN